MRHLYHLFLGILLLTVFVSGKKNSRDISLRNEFEKTIHVNTNDFIGDEEVINDTLARPELSVTYDFENEETKKDVSSPQEQDSDLPSNYLNANGEKYLSTDSSSRHMSGFQPQESFHQKSALIAIIQHSVYLHRILPKLQT